MIKSFDYHTAIFNTWKTNNSTTIFLIENLPAELWKEKVPGSPRRTIGMIASHIHNCRCSWIKMIGKDKIKAPIRVDARNAGLRDLLSALPRSSKSMLKLLEACINNKGKLLSTPAWLNFPNDVVHLLSYFVAHEGHHRGQLILLARQLNHQLPKEVTEGVWNWKLRLRESK